MYKLGISKYVGDTPSSVICLSNGACIPFDFANTDYQRFRQDITNGAELQDADGNVMTAEQVAGFMATLP